MFTHQTKRRYLIPLALVLALGACTNKPAPKQPTQPPFDTPTTSIEAGQVLGSMLIAMSGSMKGPNQPASLPHPESVFSATCLTVNQEKLTVGDKIDKGNGANASVVACRKATIKNGPSLNKPVILYGPDKFRKLPDTTARLSAAETAFVDYLAMTFPPQGQADPLTVRTCFYGSVLAGLHQQKIISDQLYSDSRKQIKDTASFDAGVDGRNCRAA